jgi:threonine/homoserine/homoserine lactone efflux protein
MSTWTSICIDIWPRGGCGPEGPLGMVGSVLLGYTAIIMVPGPTLLVIASQSALSGFRAVIPHCLGTASGALAAALIIAFGVLPPQPSAILHHAIIVISTVLMLRCGWRFASAAMCASGADRAQSPRFSAGLQFALFNPTTSGYFAAALAAQNWQASPQPAVVLAVGAGLASLGVALMAAGIAAKARLQRRTSANRIIRIVVAVLLVVLAGQQVSRIITGA